jgi:hypothetical protein
VVKGRERGGRSQSEGVESRPGYDVTNFLCTSLEGGGRGLISWLRPGGGENACIYAMAAKRPYAI